MPTYEYECEACGHHFDEFQSMSEESLTKCPECGKKKLRRLFGIGSAVLFKGSGFYETDYRSDSYKSAAKADKEATTPKPADTNGKTGGDRQRRRPPSVDKDQERRGKKPQVQGLSGR